MAELTPMKRQYNEIKSKHSDCLLFFRLGDFYEMFDDDAVTASEELDITLTTRDRSTEDPDKRTPMCGVPYHSAEAYIARLVDKGYKVAICEQTEEPAQAKGIVERDVIRVITPGTVMESSMLKEGSSNYIAGVYLDSTAGSVCFCEMTTGEFCVTSFAQNPVQHILNELGRFMPAEAVLSLGACENEELCDFLKLRVECNVERAPERFDFMVASMRVCEQFQAPGLDALGLGDSPAAVCSAGGLLSYLSDTQKRGLSHINSLDVFEPGLYMEMDYVTRRSLELTETLRTGERRGSLLWALDKTKTPMGARLMRAWVERPHLSPAVIVRRQRSVAELYGENIVRSEIMSLLKDVGDIQRLMGKVSFGSANGRDLLALGRSLSVMPKLSGMLEKFESVMLRDAAMADPLTDVTNLIGWSICDEPPFSVREGNILREGFSEEVDKLRSIRDNGARMLSELEVRERERTGIKKLKVGYNKVFGYFLDVPRSASEQVPEEYIRKQTLVSNERFFTQELKELENSLLGAKDSIAELEYEHFCKITEQIASKVVRIQKAADIIAQLDVLCSLAEVAVKNRYVCPMVDASSAIRIKDGRHPVVETMQRDILFVPNDTFLNDSDDRVAIITGPNMAGKSTYMRQTALIVLMAQMGSFVPAASAEISIVDRVFTRIGASDDLASGLSTFMVEMTETAAILKNATRRSLLILDEIGRGTSTYDGMAIARAVLEYCADKRRLGAKTMFATHYHELCDMEHEIDGVRNYNITAKKQGGSLTFLRKVVAGAADDSYGIEVAKLAGVPESVVQNAKRHLKSLEAQGPAAVLREAVHEPDSQMSITDVREEEIISRLKSVSVDTLTPIEALNLIYELKKKVEA